jgi:hypothetical protein
MRLGVLKVAFGNLPSDAALVQSGGWCLDAEGLRKAVGLACSVVLDVPALARARS